MRKLLKNADVLTLYPPVVERVDLRINAGVITARSAGLQPQNGEEVINLQGRIIMPGMVSAHTHLYSTPGARHAGPAASPG
jgi:cytosine/adenosine deaminase-related metal-dependent hydrolase